MFDGSTGHVILFSAKDENSLRGKLQNMSKHLEKHADTELSGVSYRLCSQRVHHGLRVATITSSIADLQTFIRKNLETGLHDLSPAPHQPFVIFTFTGEGSVYTGSPKLFARSHTFRDQILHLDSIVRDLGFNSVVPVVDGSASEEYATHPVTSQLAIVVLEVALGEYWKTMGIRPAAVVGHSLGEYSAMIVSGVLSPSDALYLIGHRAQLTIDKCIQNYAMLSVRASPSDVSTTLQQDFATATMTYEIACRNARKDTVLGTKKENVADMKCVLQAEGYKCTELAMAFAYHTAQMDTILDDLHALACEATFKKPTVPYISALLGQIVDEGSSINADYLKRQTRDTVNFAGAIDAAMTAGLADERTVWIDIGPHPICSNFIKALVPGCNVLPSSRRNEDTINTLTKSLVQLHLAGVDLTWSGHFADFKDDCQGLGRGKLSRVR